MKVLLLFSSHGHSVYHSFAYAFANNNIQTKRFDPNITEGLLLQSMRKIGNRGAMYLKEKYNEIIYELINNSIQLEIEKYEPDIVVSYNDSKLSLPTIKKIKEFAKFVVVLADNPYYSFFKNNFLQIALEAELVICFDSKLEEQMHMIGCSNIFCTQLGYDPNIFYPLKDIPFRDRQNYGNDILYVGTVHSLESWAYKRALLLNQFCQYDFAFFGNSMWDNILEQFLELKKHFNKMNRSMSFEELNLRQNCSKIYPIDANPGIINGIHARVFDAIGSQILPIVEFRQDMDSLFKDVNIPIFKTYSDASKLAEYYLRNDEKRCLLAKELHEFAFENYTSDKCIKKILEHIL